MTNKLANIFILSLAITMAYAADRGLAWPWNAVPQDFGLFQGSSAINWVYNWESYLPDSKPDNFEFVAMIRTAADIGQLAGNMQSNGAQILLGFNEPDNAGQANMAVSDAVSAWQQSILPFGQNGIRLGSPSPSNGPDGLPWLKDFMSQCSNCLVDFIAIHWYGGQFSDFQSYVESVNSAFPNMNIWITEFALNLDASAEDQQNFLNQAIPYLESLPYIERYSWFGAFRGDSGNSLIDNNGALTAIGQSYVSAA